MFLGAIDIKKYSIYLKHKGMIDNNDICIETMVNRYQEKVDILTKDTYNQYKKNLWFILTSQLRAKSNVSKLNTPESINFRQKIMDVLAVRDELYQLLVKQGNMSVATLDKIIELDKQLKEQEDQITTTVDLAEWREILKPKTQGWWWFLVHPWDRRDWLWGLLTAVFIVISLSLAANIVPRFWAGGPSTVGSVTAIGTSLLSLLLGKESLDQAIRGRETLERRFEDSQIPRHLQQEVICMFTGGIFVFMIGFSLSLPQIAKFYNWHGERQMQEEGGWNSDKLASAESSFQRAIALNPDNAEAHFNLGWLYERRQNLDEARTEYKIAMQGGSVIARVRLARLYILDDQEKYGMSNAVISLLKEDSTLKLAATPSLRLAQFPHLTNHVKSGTMTAFHILWEGKEEAQQADKEEEKSWYTALGWTRLQQGRFDEALNELNEAVRLQEEQKQEKENQVNDRNPLAPAYVSNAHSYCLRAQALEGQRKLQKAKDDWDKCFRLKNSLAPEVDIWSVLAKQRLGLK
ncbi:tetratricopeptide repeat protein [Coleofasciculus sp. F4-SAH-05]|uniref:tetratricopeptide repeat protein n=1 Tax=Coleofasciculus sp. F4-SAH-05 TaxID=3069525 RepID=UPI0032FCFD8A